MSPTICDKTSLHPIKENLDSVFTGQTKKIMMFNLPRNCIRDYFPSRKCFTFPQPVPERNMLKVLETLNRSQLDPEFIDVSNEFIQHISRSIRPKTLEGRPVTGSGQYFLDFHQLTDSSHLPLLHISVSPPVLSFFPTNLEKYTTSPPRPKKNQFA